MRQTYAELLKEIDAEALERILLEFSQQCVPESERVAIAELFVEVWDGKTLRGTRNGQQRAEASLVRMQAILGQIIASVRIPLDTNESQAAFEWAKSLVLTGKLIVGDAASGQRETCQQIIDSGGDYLVTVKGHQPQLLRDLELAFVIPEGWRANSFATGARLMSEFAPENRPMSHPPVAAPRCRSGGTGDSPDRHDDGKKLWPHRNTNRHHHHQRDR